MSAKRRRERTDDKQQANRQGNSSAQVGNVFEAHDCDRAPIALYIAFDAIKRIPTFYDLTAALNCIQSIKLVDRNPIRKSGTVLNVGFTVKNGHLYSCFSTC